MTRSVPTQGPNEGRRALRVFRVDPGVSALVRILSPARTVPGILTHWNKGRSLYCPGESCPECRGRGRRYWKGYVAALGYVEPEDKWLPVVLEVTEFLELDMRGVLERGQEWELSRARETSKQRQPVRGALKGCVKSADLPRAFDFLPVLMNLYHELHMEVNVVNPMPGRVMVELFDGAPPLVEVADQVEQPATVEYFRSRLNQTGQRAAANGHAPKKPGA